MVRFLVKQMEQIKTFISEKNLLAMIENAQQGKFDAIVAVNPSRILRNTDLSDAIGKLRESNKAHLITVDNQINTILNDDIAMLNLYAYINEHEAKVMSQRIKAGIRFKKEKSSVDFSGY